MEHIYWHKQKQTEPLFPDLIWAKPENKQTAGKLLIVGGNVHGFSAVGQAYSAAQQAGIGQVRIVLPDVLQKTVSKLLPEAIFVPSTPSGSFGQQALAEILEQANWADGVLVAGDLGRNSETAILLEKFLGKYRGQLTLAKDAADYFARSSSPVTDRLSTCLVLSMAQLQHLATSARFATAFKFDMDLLKLVEALHEFTKSFAPNVIIKHLDTIFAAVNGEVSTTKTDFGDEESWRIPVAASAAVWWLQNPDKPFEALTSGLS